MVSAVTKQHFFMAKILTESRTPTCHHAPIVLGSEGRLALWFLLGKTCQIHSRTKESLRPCLIVAKNKTKLWLIDGDVFDMSIIGVLDRTFAAFRRLFSR